MKNGVSIKTKFLCQFATVTIVFSGLTACFNENSTAATAQSNEARFYAMERNKDQQFLIDAGEICIEEIKFGQLAQKKSINIDIQEFGKTLENAYTKMLDELIPFAKNKSISIPISLTDKSQQTYNQLAATPLNYFNKAYCDIAVSRHQEAGAKFQKVFTESTDEDTRRWALSKLPELRRHLEFALMTQKKFEPIK
jgi:predicted outer membrane protein